ncbi:hypothetical protein AAG570_011452 [Ranatra chinensis]|uniref:Innexin n=1 Tax=Ranatra chinensis TaxID=642074 RepID=A0ABD0YKZ2_9HEMI
MFVFSKDVTKVLSFKLKQVYVDNPIFRLHYRLTFCFLVVCTVLVCTRQYIGDHINCLAGSHLTNVINTYCFFMTTYTVTRHHNSSLVESGLIPHPGDKLEGEEGIRRHNYYQWVPFVLFGQALCFYFPHFLWKTFEKGRIKNLVAGLHSVWIVSGKDIDIDTKKIKVESEEKRLKKLEGLKKNLSALMLFRTNRSWAKDLCMCELLNAVNVALQIYLSDRFLGGQFFALGRQWLKAENTAPLLDEIFPKVTKCTFYKYGQSGTMQRHDALCIMALNIINEKIYCILWFWFLILFVITCLGLLWRLVTFFGHRVPSFNKFVWGQINPGPSVSRYTVKVLSRKFTFSDWLFFYYVGKNIDGKLFRILMSKLADEIDGTTPSTCSGSDPALSKEEPESRMIVPNHHKSSLLQADVPDYPGEESDC